MIGPSAGLENHDAQVPYFLASPWGFRSHLQEVKVFVTMQMHFGSLQLIIRDIRPFARLSRSERV